MKPVKISKDNIVINMLAKANTKLVVKAAISAEGWSRDSKWRNVAIENIVFSFMNKEYVLDHIWLQQRDMKKCSLYDRVGEEVKLVCKFYQYRNDSKSGKCGLEIIKEQ